MNRGKVGQLVGAIAALHVAGLSIIFGVRQVAYMLAATVSATVIWSVVFLLKERNRRTACVVGVVLGLTAQQVAYQVWKTELPGFWWPLAQFWALQLLIGVPAAVAMKQVSRSRTRDEGQL